MTIDKTNDHLAEVVWVPTTGEEPVSDEATAGTEDKILLEKWNKSFGKIVQDPYCYCKLIAYSYTLKITTGARFCFTSSYS